MPTVIAELDRVILLIESKIPANPNSPQNLKRSEKLQRKLSDYFDSLARAFPYHRLSAIYSKYVKESLGADSSGIIDPMLSSFTSELELTIAGELADVYFEGSAEMISWGQTNAGIPITYEGPPMSEAVKWAKDHSAKLVTQVNAETKRRIAQTISDGIKNKRGIPGISRDLRNTFDSMSKYRSELIARTETASSLSQASLDRMEGMGVTGKEWITVGDDRVSPECYGNESEGAILRGQTFSGGVMAPPQHPACRCCVAPVMLKK